MSVWLRVGDHGRLTMCCSFLASLIAESSILLSAGAISDTVSMAAGEVARPFCDVEAAFGKEEVAVDGV